MTYDDFTPKSQDAILKAQQLAAGLGQQQVDTSHLLLAIFQTDENATSLLLKSASLSRESLQRKIEKLTLQLPKNAHSDKQYLTPEANKSLARSKKLLAEFPGGLITPELMLLGILQGDDRSSNMLKSLGCSEESLRVAFALTLSTAAADGLGSREALNKFALDLNALAQAGKLDPVIGRDEEIRRVLHVLSRRKKNNPLLAGEAGVGKTALVEGIAWRIVRQDVPDNLRSKRIFSLDIASLLAGARYKGEFEERLKAVMREVQLSNGQIILFIDEIHNLVGAGGGNGAMDAANILKPALARGELHLIGATTLDEYRTYFEKDQALARRFHKILIEAPGMDETISILRGVQEKYEVFHKLHIRDEALVAAVELSQRYVPDRQLPDKALDLLDEAASRLRLALDAVPEAVEGLERRVRQLEIEREALKKEGHTARLAWVSDQLAKAIAQRDELKSAWQGEREIVDNIQFIKKKIEALEMEADQVERSGDLESVARIRYGELPSLQKLLADNAEKLASLPLDCRFTKDAVTADDIAAAVSHWTGIPVSRLMQRERDRLLNLEQELHKRLIGQHQAVKAVCDAIRRSRAGLQDGNRPMGSFIFTGPSGVGKTELAKALAEVLFDDERALIRLDMSEYQEKHAASRLTGPPPGYVGYEEGGQLTEAVRRKPYSIVLLDDIEKAHPDTFNLLLQVLDEGRLTDSKGRIALFSNTIVIMTSNIGAEHILEHFEGREPLPASRWADQLAAIRGEALESLKRCLRPAFFNRVDEVVLFLPLSRGETKNILLLLLKKVEQMLARQQLSIHLSEAALDLLADLGYDPHNGVRPMKRVLQDLLVDELARQLLSGTFSPGDTIYVDAGVGLLSFGKQPLTNIFFHQTFLS
jgi:ATP-dependent Clp protease ATP-binding subunit ClpB